MSSSPVCAQDVVRAMIDVRGDGKKQLTAQRDDSFFVLKSELSKGTAWVASTRNQVGVLPLAALRVEGSGRFGRVAMATAELPIDTRVELIADTRVRVVDDERVVQLKSLDSIVFESTSTTTSSSSATTMSSSTASTSSSSAVNLNVRVFVDNAWTELPNLSQVTSDTLIASVLDRAIAAVAAPATPAAPVLYNGATNAFVPRAATVASCGMVPRDEPYRLKFFDYSSLAAKLNNSARKLQTNTAATQSMPSLPTVRPLAKSSAPALDASPSKVITPTAALGGPTRPAPKLNRPPPSRPAPSLAHSAAGNIETMVPATATTTSPPSLVSPRGRERGGAVNATIAPSFLTLPRDAVEHSASQSSPRSAPAAVDSGDGAQQSVWLHDYGFQIPSFSTVAQGGKSFTVYTVQFTSARGKERSVTKRYSDFAEMHEQLVALFPSATIPKVPGKKLINNLDKNFIEKRRGKLCNFLQSLSQQPALASSSVFLAFIEDTNEMNTDDWQELFDGLVPMPHDANAIIVQEDEPNDSLYLMDSGIVTVELGSLQLAFLGVGEWFGEHAALFGSRLATASIVAQKQVVVRRLEHNELIARVRRNPALGVRLLRTIVLRLAARSRQLPLEVAARPQMQQRATSGGGDDAVEERSVMARAEFQRRFHLSPHDTALHRFDCDYSRGVRTYDGTLFVSQRCVCFYAKMFGSELIIKVWWASVAEPAADGVELSFVDETTSKRLLFRLASPEQAQAALRAIETRLSHVVEADADAPPVAIERRMTLSASVAATTAKALLSSGSEAPAWLAIDDAEWQAILSLGRLRAYRRGACVYKQGDNNRSLFQVFRGTLRAEREAAANSPLQVLGTVEAGFVANEQAYLSGGGAREMMWAETDVRLYEIDFDKAAIFFAQNRALEVKFLHALGSGLVRRLERRENEVMQAAQLAHMQPRFYIVRFYRKRRVALADAVGGASDGSGAEIPPPPPPPEDGGVPPPPPPVPREPSGGRRREGDGDRQRVVHLQSAADVHAGQLSAQVARGPHGAVVAVRAAGERADRVSDRQRQRRLCAAGAQEALRANGVGAAAA
jgi:CRP-like cAMP-binding protein